MFRLMPMICSVNKDYHDDIHPQFQTDKILYHKLEEPQVQEAVTSLLTVLLIELIYKIIQAF